MARPYLQGSLSRILIAGLFLVVGIVGCGEGGKKAKQGGGGGGGGGPVASFGVKQFGTIADDIGWGVATDPNRVRDWSYQLGTAVDDIARGVATDATGNIFITGETAGNLDGETNAGGKDIFLVKYNSSGTKQWTRLLGTAVDDIARGVATDATGNIFITGETAGSLNGQPYVALRDIFLVKFKPDGTQEWTKELGTANDDIAYGVATDENGNIFITGETAGNLDGETNAGGKDIILVKYNSSGTKQLTRLLGTTVNDIGRSVATDTDGNIFITGETAGNLFGTNAGLKDVFLVKYDSLGNMAWGRRLGTTVNDIGRSVATDTDGNIFVTGETNSSFFGINKGNADIFLMKFDSSGNRIWATQLGTTADDIGQGVATDGSENVFVTGETSGSLFAGNAGGRDVFLVKFKKDGNIFVTGETSGSLFAGNAGGRDVFLVKFKPDGSQDWATQLGTTADDISRSVATDKDGNIFVTGETQGNLFGTNAGGRDVFLVKFKPDGPQDWATQLGTTADDISRSVATDKDGNIFVTGETQGNLFGTNAGGRDIFLVKYDSSGNRKWTRQLGTIADDIGHSVATSATGNIFVTGETQGNLGRNTNAGFRDIFLTKFDSAGVLQ